MKEKIKILGIDPGSRLVGWALIQVEGKSIKYIASGVIDIKDSDHLRKPAILYKNFLELIAQYKPDEFSLESLIFKKGPTSLIKLSQARGAILAALGKEVSHQIFEYSPNLIKVTAAGHGHADKKEIRSMLIKIFTELNDYNFKSFDESDALAIAFCHYIHIHKSKISYKIQSGIKQKKKRLSLKEVVKHRI